MGERVERPLGRYRVLELPGLAPLLAGKTLADLGADVIKVEPPGGDPARYLPPLIDSVPESAGPRSPGLIWAAYDIGKRHVTADLTTDAGRDLVRRLAAEADVLIEGFAPGEMDRLDIGPARLRQEHPGLIITSLSAFGQDGPYAGWRGSDLVQFAMSGYLNMTGPADGPPLKPSAPFQTYLHGAMQAVAATLLALRRREQTGEGAHVDQALRDTGIWMLTHTYQFWDLLGVNLKRQGAARDMGGVRRLRSIFPCKDGHVVWLAVTGHIGGASMQALVEWMAAESMAPDWLRAIDWMEFDYLQKGPEMVERLETVFAAFFATKRKAELLDWALAHRLMLAPVQNLGDVLDDPQLAARDAWRTVRIAGVPEPVRVPGPPVQMSDAVWEPRDVSGSEAEGVAAWQPWPARNGHERGARQEGASRTGNLPLAGIRVVDFSTTVAGPSASRHLADFGAEVIKIESLAHVDGLRNATPYADRTPGINRSGYFAAYNAGKKSLALNMQKPAARDVVRRLIERADVLLEAYVPGVMARWGLTWEQVSAWNPRIIMASHCLQGQWGPRAGHRGYGQIASAMSGWYDLTGLPGEEPVGPYSAYTDFICWPYLLTAILVALDVRDQTGRGQRIDHAQLETSVHFLAPLLLDLQINGRLAVRRGNREDYAVPNNVYRCAGDDRWLAVTVTTDVEWAALCAALGHPEAAADPRFTGCDARKAHEADLDSLIGAWTRDADAFALAERLQAAGVAAGAVARAQDLFADPQLAHRGFFRRLNHVEIGEHAVLTQTFRISGMEPGPFIAAPLLGEHTYQICTDVLGMDADEIAALAAEGVFE
jgi:crotonobetainyl-CoA:carnitine CoA-transferase CaiB-like acyl-CoA transferase